MNNKQIKALLASYGRSVLAAAVALYLAGITDPLDLLKALLAGLLPVALRYLNKKDPAFGIVAKVIAEPYIAKLADGEVVIPKKYAESLDTLAKEIATNASKTTVKAPASKSQQKRVAVQTEAAKPVPKKKPGGGGSRPPQAK